MRTYLDCYPCFLRQALEASRMAGATEPQQQLVLDRVLDVLKDGAPSRTPPQIGSEVHRIVREEVGAGDPYQEAKDAATSQALELYPELERLVEEADDRLDTSIRLSIAGNIIDMGPARTYDLWGTVERVLAQPFAIDHGLALLDALARARQVLYLADNAGETVFDRLLIKALDVPVVYGVKGGPVVNDATRDDAVAAGVDQVAQIVGTGSGAPGTILEQCSDEFQALYNQAELVIAKGQANYETLSEEGAKVFFLLQTKCPVIARDVGVPVMSIVLKQG